MINDTQVCRFAVGINLLLYEGWRVLGATGVVRYSPLAQREVCHTDRQTHQRSIGGFMDFARGNDGEAGQQYRHGSAAFANPTTPVGGSEQNPQGSSANDPQVHPYMNRCS